VNTVDHVLNELFLGLSESSSVGNIENSIIGLGVLSVDTSDLDLVFISDLVELLLLGHELWELDMDGGSHGGSEVGWARGNVTEMLVMSKLDISGLEVGNGSAKSVENFDDTGILLHGNDSELILLVDPDQEGFGVVMEDSSAGWPVSVEVAGSQESVSLLEEEMVVDELLLNGSVHTLEWVESTLEVALEGVAGGDNLGHDLVSLGLADTWAERVVSQVSSNSDSSRVDHGGILLSELGVLDAVGGHIGGVLGIRTVLVVVGDDLIEQLVEGTVSVVRSSVKSDTRVLVLDT